MRLTHTPIILAAAVAFGCSEGIAPAADAGPMQAGVGRVIHRVTVGGPDACVGLGGSPGCDANFSLVALQYADGSVSGQWHDQFVHPFGGVHVTVTCLSISGNQAWISGVISHGLDAGFPVVTRVADNGRSANDPPDQIGLTTAVADFGDCNAHGEGFGLFDAPQGQSVVVQ